jgi:hypothetical protein
MSGAGTSERGGPVVFHVPRAEQHEWHCDDARCAFRDECIDRLVEARRSELDQPAPNLEVRCGKLQDIGELPELGHSGL